MPAPATADAFLAIVRKSNQVDPARLAGYLGARAGVPASEPRKLAASLVRAGVLTLFQAEQFLQGKHKGFGLGGYRIVERIGTGGTGTVYLAEHQAMKRWVAIKVLPTPLAADPTVRERFRREAQATALLDHPNVIHVYDFRDEGGLHAIIMEYAKGPNLQQLVTRRGAQPVAASCEYARQAALGLHHAHQAGLVHRDVKPANLLLDQTGVLKVLDLGLARYQADGESSLTQEFNSKMVMGTADFLPPEQALSLHDVDHRADLYALGATLYTLLAGRPPFHDGSIGQKLLWHQTRTPERLDRVRPDVPGPLADLVQRMLAKKPSARPASCAEVATALERWVGPGDIRPSAATLEEFSLTSQSLALPGSTSRALPEASPAPDTLNAKGQEETGRIPKETPAPPTRPAAPPAAANPALLLVAGAFALAAGLLGGMVAILLMNLRG
ncbi:MAG: serine/threonine-protein kinase [Gemmataceae bacterium]